MTLMRYTHPIAIFFCALIVSIFAPQTLPTVTEIVSGSPLFLDKLKTDGKETITLQGTNLDSVTSVNLALNGKTLSYKPDPGATPVKLQFTVQAAAPPDVGEYTVTLDTAAQKGIAVGTKMVVQATPPAPAPQPVAGDIGSQPAQSCSNTPGALTGAKVALSSTSSGSPETMVDMRITGTGLSKFKTVVLCFKLTNSIYLPSDKLVRFDPLSSGNGDGLLAGTLSVFPTALKGDYSILLSGDNGLVDSKLTFTVRSSNNGQYADCPDNSGPVIGNESLYCSQALLDYKQTKKIFGKGVADQYIAVEVVVRNIDDDYEYILHDIRLGTTRAVVASIDRKLVRGVAENSELFSTRAIAVRLTEASASLFSGIAAVIGTANIVNAASILAGPGVLGLKHSIPDLTVAELNRVNDLSFSAGGIVVPKHSAVPLVAFLSSNIFVPGCTQGTNLDACKKNGGSFVQIAFKDLSHNDLMNFQQGLIVQVAGAHVQEVTQVSAQNISGSPLDLSKLKTDGKEIISLNGTGLDAVTAVHLVSGSNTLTYTPLAVSPADPNKLQFEIDEAKAPTAANYTITLDTAAKKSIQTNLSLDIESGGSSTSAAPSVSRISIGSPLVLDNLKKDGKETITLQGTNLDSVTSVNLVLNGKTLSYKPEPGATPIKLQFTVQAATPPDVGEYAITLDTATQKGITVDSKIVLQVTQSSVIQPAVTKIIGSPLSLTKLKTDGKEIITLQGTNLDTVTAINLASAGKTLTYKPQNPTPTKLDFAVEQASPPSAGTYTFTLDTAAKKGIAISKKISFQVIE